VNLLERFAHPKAVIGMIHVGALPGTPGYRGDLSGIVEQAVAEAVLYSDAGLDGLLIENMHDVPYLCGQVGPEIVAGMTAVGLAVRRAGPLPLGVQILAAANDAALATAQTCGAAFVRVENFAYAHVADEGLMPVAEAGPLLRYRRQIGAVHVAILADVKKKHASHALTADVPLAQAARTIEFFGADGIIVTGTATGEPTAAEDVLSVRSAVHIPVCIGSGLTPDNLPALWPHAEIFIVGSFFKTDGLWSNAVEPRRLRTFMEVVSRLRAGERPPGATIP
jgi:membrane complex biogenesis BtpA family protein